MNPEPTDTPIPEGIRCGCGFSANTGDNFRDECAHTDHVDVCPNQPTKPPRSWAGDIADAIFSFWGVIITVIIASTLIYTHRH